MRLRIYQVDAFADRPFTGNPAAVIPLDEWLPDETLQAIAEENNLSETVYLVPENGEYQLRWFTPTTEVDLCGHATLAASRVLFDSECRSQTEIRFASRSGPLSVSREGEQLTLDFPADVAIPCEVPSLLSEALGLEPTTCLSATDTLAVLSSEQEVVGLQPDFRKLAQLEGRGVIVTAVGESCDFVCRFFAPRYGIDEDPVTGSAYCTLAPYWSEALGVETFAARQLSARGGKVACQVVGDRVRISGTAVHFLEGWINL